MDQIKLEVTGDLRFGLLDRVLRHHEQTAKAVKKATFDIEALAKRAIKNGPKTGRIYREETEVSFTTKDGTEVSFTAYKKRRGKKYKPHQASAPGEAPASDTGNLVNSIKAELRNDFEGEITVAAAYAATLEYGGGRIAARPFLAPAVREVAPLFLKAIEKATLG